MRLSLLPLAAAALVAADPVPTQFQLMALRSASPVHFAQVSAAHGSLFLALSAQNATCVDGTTNSAILYTDDSHLLLYTDPATPQQLYADRSGMGQGKFGYTTGSQTPPRNAELGAFAVDASDDLTLNGESGFIACPGSIDQSWSLWANAGVANPGGNKDCLGVTLRAQQVTKAYQCSYTP